MTDEPAKFSRWRREMVAKQIMARGIDDPLVIQAMTQIPRHRFVSEGLVDSAYGESPLPIGEGQTISQPFIIAEMTRRLALTGRERVLEVGTGSGYQAAVLSRIVYKVYTIERNNVLYLRARKLFDRLKYHNIVTRYSDGTQGWPAESPFDAIMVTAGGYQVPEPLIDQLVEGGRLVMPVGGLHAQTLLRIEKTGTGIRTERLCDCRFVKLIGEYGWPT